MTKFFSILLLFAFLVSCQDGQQCSTPSKEIKSDEKPLASSGCSAEAPIPDDPETGTPVPNEAFLFNANVTFTKFEVADVEKVNKAIEIIKTIVASQEFKDRVLNFTYQGEHRFVDTKLKNAEVYQKLLEGREDLRPEIDHEMDLDLELYYSSKSTVGYTYPNGLRIWMNRKFFNSYTPAQVAGNIFHEWTHKLGFDHASSYSVSRDSSVPYALGHLIEELGKKYE